jgi:hypothetical protein
MIDFRVDNTSGNPEARIYYKQDITSLVLATANTNAVYIDSSQNVGIGSAPDSNTPLHIKDATYGRVRIESTGSNSFAILYLKNDAIEYAVRTNGSDVFEVRDDTAGAVRLALDSNSRISLSNNDGGTSNTVFGYEAGNLIGAGDNYNVFIGHQVADADMTDAIQNVGIGYQALTSLTTGVSNTGVGSGSLYNINTGNYNVAMGHLSADALTSSQYNVAIGYGSLSAEVTSGTAVAIGFEALGLQNKGDTDNSENVGVGFQAGLRNVTGTGNTSVGFEAMKGASGQSNSFNTAIGKQALLNVTTGSYNVAIGNIAMDSVTTGGTNVAIGSRALATSQAPLYNVAIGGDALFGVPSGQAITGAVAIGTEAFKGGSSTEAGSDKTDYTIAIGQEALKYLETGHGCVAIGYGASENVTTGSWNTVIGYEAFNTGTGANNTTAFGYRAGKFLGDDGQTNHSSFNTIIGRSAMAGGDTSTPANNTANLNIAIGHVALGGNTSSALTATHNTVIGYASMNLATSATNNVTMGYGAMQNATTPSSNVAIGMQVMGSGVTTGSENVAIGKDSMYDATSSTGVVAIGTESANNITSGSESVAVGKQALYTATTVGANTAVGYQALKLNAVAGNTAIGHSAGLNTTGTANVYVGASAGTGASGAETYNTGIGYQALYDITSGSSNVVVGALAGENITTGAENTIVGTGAFRQAATGYDNVVIGREAMGLGYVEGHDNVVVGKGAGYDVTTGNDNTLVGRASGGNITTGEGNTLIGYQSGNTGTVDIVGGTYNTFIGYQARGSSATSINQIVIGKTAQGQGNNSVTLGNADVTNVYMAQDKGATVHANYVLSQGNQNHVCNTMSSPYYRFDGTDDSISCTAISGMNNFSLAAWAKAPDWDDNNHHNIICAYSSGGNNDWYRISILNDGTITFSVDSGDDHSGLVQAKYTHSLVDDTWHHIVGVCDQRNNLLYLYVDGVNVVNATYSDDTPINVSNLRIGSRGDSNSSENWIGEISQAQVWNVALTGEEVKELYSGSSVPYKYSSASQTDMVTNGGFADGSNWTISGGWDINTTTAGKARFLKDGSGIDYIEQDVGLIKGKMYRVTFTISNATNAQLAIYNKDTSNYASIQNSSPSFSNFTNTADGTYVVDFLATASGKLVIAGHQNSGSAWDLDDVSLIPIGAVAQYDGSGIASDKWFDKSGNDNHGAIVAGATAPSVENAPSSDDGLVYEDGTWDPTPADAANGGNTAAAGTATGYYTRIGRMVHCEFTLVNINTTGMTGGNDFFVQGLPYTVANHAGHAHGSVALENVNFTGEYVTISPSGGTTAIRFAEVPDNSNIDIVVVSEINDDSADIYGHFSYMAT